MQALGFFDSSLPKLDAYQDLGSKSWEELLVAHPTSKNPSAVAVIFFPPANKELPADILLIRRSIKVKSHQNQMAFPGGRKENSDQTPFETALRETEEEVGLNPTELTPLFLGEPILSLDQSLVFPAVFLCHKRSVKFQTCQEEVEYTDLQPWNIFQSHHANFSEFVFYGHVRKTPIFALPSSSVWGLTAQILIQLNFKR